MILRVTNPQNLPVLSEAWASPLLAYDPDLRIFPSQTRPIYRLARVARHMPMRFAKFKRETVHPDTAIALTHGLVLLTFGLPGDIGTKSAVNIVAVLRSRDTWALLGEKNSESERLGERLDETEAADERKADADFRDYTRQIGKVARRAVLYRTGQRISLVSPMARQRTPAPTAPS